MIAVILVVIGRLVSRSSKFLIMFGRQVRLQIWIFCFDRNYTSKSKNEKNLLELMMKCGCVWQWRNLVSILIVLKTGTSIALNF